MQWPARLKLVLGIWLFVSPWILRHGSGVAMTEEMVLGALICIAAIWSATTRMSILVPAWTTFALGVWSVLAPSVLGYRMVLGARFNDVAVGFLVVMLTAVQIGLSWRSREQTI